MKHSNVRNLIMYDSFHSEISLTNKDPWLKIMQRANVAVSKSHQFLIICEWYYDEESVVDQQVTLSEPICNFAIHLPKNVHSIYHLWL